MTLIQNLAPDEWNLIREGKIVAAIAKVRGRIGGGLKECKDLVDRAREVYPKGPPIINRPLTEILEAMLSSLESMEYHVRTNDFAQLERMRVGLQEQTREALRTTRGWI